MESKKTFKEKYRQLYEVGSGTYGKVYKVVSNDSDKKFYAFKKINYSKDNEGFPQTALREIKILKSLNHKNVIKLHEIMTSKPSENNNYRGSTFLIFDYFEHDLWGLIKNKVQYSPAQLKCIMKQILEGVDYLHSNKIIHRDLKSANILVSEKGLVQIADFGLARNLNSLSGHYTSCVVTLWYRAPELLLGLKKYTTQVDMWSIGTIMAELLLGEPLFPGDKEPRQCEMVFQKCGTPTEENWPGCRKLPLYSQFVNENNIYPRTIKDHIGDRLPFLDKVTLDFLDKLLALDPEKRLTAKKALEHEYFSKEPLPCEPKELPRENFECHITLMSGRRKAAMQEEDQNNKKRRNPEFSDRPDRRGSHPYQPPPPNKSPEIENDNHNWNNGNYYSDTKARMPPIIQPDPPSRNDSAYRGNLFSKDERYDDSGRKRDYKDGEMIKKKVH